MILLFDVKLIQSSGYDQLAWWAYTLPFANNNTQNVIENFRCNFFFPPVFKKHAQIGLDLF